MTIYDYLIFEANFLSPKSIFVVGINQFSNDFIFNKKNINILKLFCQYSYDTNNYTVHIRNLIVPKLNIFQDFDGIPSYNDNLIIGVFLICLICIFGFEKKHSAGGVCHYCLSPIIIAVSFILTNQLT